MTGTSLCLGPLTLKSALLTYSLTMANQRFTFCPSPSPILLQDVTFCFDQRWRGEYISSFLSSVSKQALILFREPHNLGILMTRLPRLAHRAFPVVSRSESCKHGE